MATVTLPQVWRGRTGRAYVPADARGGVRHGSMATVRKVMGRSGPVGTSTVADGVPLALKLWTEGGDDESIEHFQSEARVLAELSSRPGEIPCPRLYDLVGNPVITGLLMEWCPVDLERWWSQKLSEPEAFGRLMATLAEACRRVDDYHRFYEKKDKAARAHGDLKSSNILLDIRGRWLISDFGLARVQMPGASLETSTIVAGTENFIAPEALFHAKQPFPPALDTFSIAATSCSLLRMRRVVLDGGALPRNGSHSARFRMHRVHQMLDLFERDPGAFVDRHIDPSVFEDPQTLPDPDRHAVREALRGVFGAEDAKREEQLCDAYSDVLERATAIDPAHRYTRAADLAVALEALTRTFISLASSGGGPVASPAAPETDERAPATAAAERRAEELQRQVEGLRAEVERLRRQTEARAAEEAREALQADEDGGSAGGTIVVVLAVVLFGVIIMLAASMMALGVLLAVVAMSM